MNSVASNMPDLIDVGPSASQLGDPIFYSKNISYEMITNLPLPEYSTAANGLIDSISTVTLLYKNI